MSRRPRHLLAPLLVVVVTGCGAAEGPPRDAAPAVDSSPTASASTPAPRTSSPAPRPTAPKPRTRAEQAALDERLRAAAWRNDVGTARRLVHRGADVNAKDDTQQSAYLIAASEGYLELLRLALGHGAEVDDKDSWNGTALIRAAERGHAFVVGELLQADIDRDHVNRIGYQAVHEAVWLGEDTTSYATTLRVLAAGGVRLADRSVSEGLTPLEMAVERGYDGLREVLAAITTAPRPADPDAALLRAARAGDADAVAVAIRAGADLRARGRTALRLAAAREHAEVVDLLVALGATR